MTTPGANYLYGDSTPSTLKTNFLEFVRDALDFSVFVVQADERIERVEQRIATLRREADEEMDRLDTFVGAVTKAIDGTPKGGADSPTSQCAAHLTQLAAEALRASLNRVREKLAADIAEAEAEIAMERAASVDALATLLRPHDPPDATSSTEVAIGDGGVYLARASGSSELGLAWTFDAGVKEGSTWSSIVRVERFAPQLEIRAPQLSGWISKEVKIRPLKIDKLVVTGVVDDGETLSFALRAEPAFDSGFDIEVSGGEVTAARIDPKADASAGEFDVHEEDAPKLVDLAGKLRASLADVTRDKLAEATVGDEAFGALRRFVPFVESMVGMMAPIVREIADRSLTPTELVIRRLLGNDRREEIFVTKAALREKYAKLTSSQRALFAPLGLDVAPPARRVSMPVEEPPPVRAELTPSHPPPAPSRAPSKAPSKAPGGGDASADVIPGPPPMPSDGEGTPAAASSMSLRVAASKNEGLKAALKHIVGLAKRGATDEAYQGYATLFSSEEFGAYRLEDRRQALRLMVFSKTQAPSSESVLAAHRAALGRLEALVDESKEPADFEMLGVTQALLEDATGARASFEAGLARERDRDASSELVGKLVRRLGELAGGA